jgi:hypothetical protein
MSTPWMVTSSPVSSATNAVASIAGAATSTPGTARIFSATSSGKSAPSPALTCRAARPAIVSMISMNARSTARFTRSVAATSATPDARATTVSASHM